MRLLVTGGCGYVGSVLVPKLLNAGHEVHVIDTQWFGNYLKPHPKLAVTKADIREDFALDYEAIIHLAGIANDPTGDLDPKLTWEVNALATMRLADEAVRSGVKQFIYASSGSVYGVSKSLKVTEDLPLVPLSEYNKTKMVAERVLLSYSKDMSVQILRPATVCGVSPRMRLDVAVNALAFQGVKDGQINVFGGSQYRPNIHIEDMADLYLWMLERPHLTGIYNAGFENMTIRAIADRISERLGCALVIHKSIDPRSYRVCSEKILSTGFRPKKTVSDAIEEIIFSCRENKLSERIEWFNLKAMKAA